MRHEVAPPFKLLEDPCVFEGLLVLQRAWTAGLQAQPGFDLRKGLHFAFHHFLQDSRSTAIKLLALGALYWMAGTWPALLLLGLIVATMMDLQAWRQDDLEVTGPPDLQPLAETLDLVSRMVPRAKGEVFHTLEHIFDFSGYELLEQSNLCGAGLLWLSTSWLTPGGQVVELACALDLQLFTERWKIRVVPEEHVRRLLSAHPEAYRKVFGEPQTL